MPRLSLLTSTFILGKLSATWRPRGGPQSLSTTYEQVGSPNSRLGWSMSPKAFRTALHRRDATEPGNLDSCTLAPLASSHSSQAFPPSLSRRPLPLSYAVRSEICRQTWLLAQARHNDGRQGPTCFGDDSMDSSQICSLAFPRIWQSRNPKTIPTPRPCLAGCQVSRLLSTVPAVRYRVDNLICSRDRRSRQSAVPARFF